MIFSWTINFWSFSTRADHRHQPGVLVHRQAGQKDHYLFWYYVLLVVVVFSGFMVRNLLRTRYGRCLSAVRDNDRAADAMGMHPGLTKVYAFGLAGFFAGMAGALHAYVYRGVGFESFTLHHSITYLAMAIVGGLGTLTDLSGGRRPLSLLELQVETLPNTPVNIPSDMESGHRPEAAFFRPGDRPVFDV
jgi:branched-chain amino acid transport system permease protein